MRDGWLVVAAASGFVAVAAGAFGSHVLEERLTERDFDIFRTAVRYQMFHTLALLAVLALPVAPRARALVNTCFLIGLVLFSGSLYVLVLSQTRWLGAVTPVGGTAFLVGWAGLLWSGWRARATREAA